MIRLWCEGNRLGGTEGLPVLIDKEYGQVRLSCRLLERKGLFMEINVSEEVQTQLDQVKEWMESKIGREVTYNDVILQILKNFQSVLYPEDLGSA
jgi:hypothetical protein